MREFAFTPDRRSPDPLYRQLVNYFEELMDSGRLLPGERLPPTRELAGAIGLGRNTVALGYEILESSGRVTSHVGRGTFVAGGAPAPLNPASGEAISGGDPIHAERALAWSGLFAARTQALVRLPSATSLPTEVPFDFRGGRVDPSGVPVFEFQKAHVRALQQHLKSKANHFDPLGYEPLREEIARLLVSRGIRCSAADVLITNGAQQGLDLIARALLDPGDSVVIERPGYFGATLAFRGAQAQLLGVDVDADGIRVDEIYRLVRTRRIKLIYVTPAVQMPTGVTLDEARRSALLELADREQIPILEDDYDAEFRGEGPIIPALKTADAAGRVVYVGTLTKVMYPGLRLGYVVAASPLLDMLSRVRFAANFQPSLIDQIAASEFMKSGDYAHHVRRLRKRHEQKRQELAKTLTAKLPEQCRWSRARAGATIWIDLPIGFDLDELQRKAFEHGVAFNRGDLFRLGGGEPAGIGLCFSSLSLPQIREGAEILADLLTKSLKQAASSHRSASRSSAGEAGEGKSRPKRKIKSPAKIRSRANHTTESKGRN